MLRILEPSSAPISYVAYLLMLMLMLVNRCCAFSVQLLSPSLAFATSSMQSPRIFFLERENLNLTLLGYLPDCVSDDQNVAFLFQFIRCLAVRAELLKYSKMVMVFSIIIKHNPWRHKPHLCLPLDRELVWCRGPQVPGLVCSPGTSEKVIEKEESACR